LYYLLIVCAAVFLALEFSCSKKYQALEGVSPAAGLRFNALSGLFSAVLMWAVSGFHLEWSAFSLILAFALSLCGIIYSLLGFHVLQNGGMALYSTFLMCGGMVLPYLYGAIFLQETITLPRILGLAIILVAVICSNPSKEKVHSKLLALCTAVFILNGCVSILSKCHQVNTRFSAVNTSMFVVYCGITKCLLSTLSLLFFPRQRITFVSIKKPVLLITAGASLISGLSYLMQLAGAKALPASVLYPFITGGSIVFSAIASRIFFRETITKRQILCIALCVIGTLLFL